MPSLSTRTIADPMRVVDFARFQKVVKLQCAGFITIFSFTIGKRH